jgi:hypothetical protein
VYTASNLVPASIFVGAAVAGYVVAIVGEIIEAVSEAFGSSEETPARPVPRHVRQARCEPGRLAAARR